MNGETILNNQQLSQEKKHFELKLHPGLNVLYIDLGYEGSEPPNTPHVILEDGNTKHELAVSGNIGEVVRLCIWR